MVSFPSSYNQVLAQKGRCHKPFSQVNVAFLWSEVRAYAHGQMSARSPEGCDGRPWAWALTSLHTKSKPNLGKGLVAPSLLGEYPGASEALKSWGVQKWAWQKVESATYVIIIICSLWWTTKAESISQSHSFLITFLEKLNSEASVALYASLITKPKTNY